MSLTEQIQELGVVPQLREVLVAVASARSTETDRQGQYISVRPAGRAVAAYFHKEYVDVAVEPEDAAGLAGRFADSTIIPKTSATHYVHVPAGSAGPDLVDVIIASIDRREQGPAWSGAWSHAGAAQPEVVTCPVCFLQVTPAGACGC